MGKSKTCTVARAVRSKMPTSPNLTIWALKSGQCSASRATMSALAGTCHNRETSLRILTGSGATEHAPLRCRVRVRRNLAPQKIDFVSNSIVYRSPMVRWDGKMGDDDFSCVQKSYRLVVVSATMQILQKKGVLLPGSLCTLFLGGAGLADIPGVFLAEPVDFGLGRL